MSRRRPVVAVALCAVLAAGLIVGLVVVPGHKHTAAATRTAPSVSASQTPTPTATTVIGATGNLLRFAVTFADDWTSMYVDNTIPGQWQDISGQAWHDRLVPLTTPTLMADLDQIPPFVLGIDQPCQGPALVTSRTADRIGMEIACRGDGPLYPAGTDANTGRSYPPEVLTYPIKIHLWRQRDGSWLVGDADAPGVANWVKYQVATNGQGS